MAVDPQAIAQSMPFARALGIEVTAAVPDEVRGGLDWTPERCTTGGVLHGAALMALGDTLGAICAFLNLPAGARGPGAPDVARGPGPRGAHGVPGAHTGGTVVGCHRRRAARGRLRRPGARPPPLLRRRPLPVRCAATVKTETMTSRAVFVDTGAWVALRYRRDSRHTTARALLERLHTDGLGLVTTEWVLAETVTWLKARC